MDGASGVPSLQFGENAGRIVDIHTLSRMRIFDVWNACGSHGVEAIFQILGMNW